MYNMFERLKQKEAHMNLDENIKQEYISDREEMMAEMNEDFIETVIDKLLLIDLRKKIEQELKYAKTKEQLDETTFSIKIEYGIGYVPYDGKGSRQPVYNFLTPGLSYRDKTNKVSTDMCSGEYIYMDDKLTEMFEKRLMDRLSVYSNKDKENRTENPINKIDNIGTFTFRITASVKELIEIYYGELQYYNYRNRTEKPQDFDEKSVAKAGKSLVRSY